MSKVVKLKELIKINNGKDYKHLGNGDVPVYGSGGLMTTVDDYFYDGESILLPRKGTLNNIMYVNGKFWTVDTMYWTTINQEKVYPKYLYCYLSLLDLSSKDSGSTLPSMTFDAYYDLPIVLLDSDIQKKIGDLYFLVTNKISTNNHINAELESMAKTIYDYWFLQFEFPDENGKPYKSSGGKMVWNEELKRDIPEGWRVSALSTIEGNIVTGKTPSTKISENFGGDIPFITIGDIRGNVYITSTEQKLTTKGAETQLKKYIPKNSLCVSCIASPGLIGFATTESQTNQQINSIAFSDENNMYYLYFALNDFFKHSVGAKTGNTFVNMNKEEFSNIRMVYSNEIVSLFFKKVSSIFNMIHKNSEENQQLASLRDFLLPLLMNGQVGFKED